MASKKLTTHEIAFLTNFMHFLDVDDLVREAQQIPAEDLRASMENMGIDYEAFHRRADEQLQRYLDEHAAAEGSPIRGLVKLIGRLGQELWSVSNEGLFQFSSAFAPVTLDEAPENIEGLEETLIQKSNPVVPVSLRPEGGDLRLGFRWLRQFPTQPPEVQVFADSQPWQGEAVWEWDNDPAHVQLLSLRNCPFDEERLCDEEVEVLRYRFDAERNLLSLGIPGSV